MLNLFQHLWIDETLKRVQGDVNKLDRHAEFISASKD